MHAFVLWRCFNQNIAAGPQAGCDVPILRDAQFLLIAPLQRPWGGQSGALGSEGTCPPQPYCGSYLDTFSFVFKTSALARLSACTSSSGREIRDMKQLFKHR